MKNRNALIFLLCIVLLAFAGWMAVLGSKTEDHTDEFNALVQNGDRYMEHEVYTKAYSAYASAYALIPGYDIAMKTADAAKTLGNYSNMEDYCLLAIECDSTQSAPYEELLDYYINSGEYAQAFEFYYSITDVTDRGKIEEYYDILHGGTEEGYTNIDEFYGWHYDYAVVRINESYGVVNAGLSEVTAIAYEDIGMYNSSVDLVPVKTSDGWLYCSSGGYKNSLAVGYDTFGNFGNSLAPVAMSEKYTYVDAEGNMYDSKNGEWIAFDTLEEDGFPELYWDYAGSFTYGVAAVKKDGKWALINTSMELITDYEFDDVILNEYGYCANGQVVIAKKDGEYHLYGLETGEQIGDEGFSDAKPFESGQPTAVCRDGLWGFVSAAGEMVVEPQYEDAIGYSANYAAVKQDGLWGYIDMNGMMEVTPEYEWVSAFSTSGIALVRYPEAEGLRTITLYEYIED